MTDSLQTDSPPPIPRTMVLGYFGSTAGPTRVRGITALGLLLLAILDTGLAGLLAWHLYTQIVIPIYHLCLAGVSWLEVAGAAGGFCLENPVPLLLLCCALSAFLLIIATIGVYRGRRWACRIALLAAVVHLLLFILCSAVALTAAVYLLNQPDRAQMPVWTHVLRFGLGGLSGLLALLAIDLCAFLRWIARTPDANPPPRKFV